MLDARSVFVVIYALFLIKIIAVNIAFLIHKSEYIFLAVACGTKFEKCLDRI